MRRDGRHAILDAVTKRAPTHRGGAKSRALSQSDAIPKDDLDEITDRIEVLASHPPPHKQDLSSDDLGKILSSFEASLLELNKSLTNATRANRSTVKSLSEECKKTTETVADLNTELALVVRRSETG